MTATIMAGMRNQGRSIIMRYSTMLKVLGNQTVKTVNSKPIFNAHKAILCLYRLH